MWDKEFDALAEMSSVDLRQRVLVRWDVTMLCPCCNRAIIGHSVIKADRCLIQLGEIRQEGEV